MNLLTKIIEQKREEIRMRKRLVSLQALSAQVAQAPPARDFTDALVKSNGVAVIAEIKKASPSRGVLRKSFDACELARCYATRGAAALSVLTDEPFFQGTPEHLRLARKQVSVPVLQKDFTLDPYQVVEARGHGADAILLILSVLGDGQCRELAAAAREFGLCTLVECHTRAELERALSGGFSCIGINNRDLTNFSIDLTTAERLASSVPQEVTLVSESGIACRADVERLGRCGIDAVLVGEVLLRG